MKEIKFMSLELAAMVWKECRTSIIDNGDIREAADGVVAILMEHYSADEIRDAFKFDGAIKMAVGDYLGEVCMTIRVIDNV
jgi:hypothetical protein